MKSIFLIAVLLLGNQAGVAASPAQAAKIHKAWDADMASWAAALEAATTPDQVAAARKKQPDPVKAAESMWQAIGSQLDQSWTLEHMAWFLEVTPGLLQLSPQGARVQIFAEPLMNILDALDRHHLRSEGLTPVCMALAGNADPRTLPLLEKIIARHPDPKIQGVASLAAAVALRSLGDEPDLMRKRLTHLRKAIIDSSDVEVRPSTTVAQIAEDELYRIRYLSKGRKAPDLVGKDSGGRPLKLSSYQGKIVVLVFWSETMNDADHAIQLINQLHDRYQSGQAVKILGVNADPLPQLRSLEGSDAVKWSSFSDPSRELAQKFRVSSWPLVFVLDADRRIQFTGTPGSFVDLTVDALLSEMPSQPNP
ncbi:MAG: peroxiredoxin family protein [Luteolibacter sp.]